MQMSIFYKLTVIILIQQLFNCRSFFNQSSFQAKGSLGDYLFTHFYSVFKVSNQHQQIINHFFDSCIIIHYDYRQMYPLKNIQINFKKFQKQEIDVFFQLRINYKPNQQNIQIKRVSIKQISINSTKRVIFNLQQLQRIKSMFKEVTDVINIQFSSQKMFQVEQSILANMLSLQNYKARQEINETFNQKQSQNVQFQQKLKNQSTERILEQRQLQYSQQKQQEKNQLEKRQKMKHEDNIQSQQKNIIKKQQKNFQQFLLKKKLKKIKDLNSSQVDILIKSIQKVELNDNQKKRIGSILKKLQEGDSSSTFKIINQNKKEAQKKIKVIKKQNKQKMNPKKFKIQKKQKPKLYVQTKQLNKNLNQPTFKVNQNIQKLNSLKPVVQSKPKIILNRIKPMVSSKLNLQGKIKFESNSKQNLKINVKSPSSRVNSNISVKKVKSTFQPQFSLNKTKSFLLSKPNLSSNKIKSSIFLKSNTKENKLKQVVQSKPNAKISMLKPLIQSKQGMKNLNKLKLLKQPKSNLFNNNQKPVIQSKIKTIKQNIIKSSLQSKPKIIKIRLNLSKLKPLSSFGLSNTKANSMISVTQKFVKNKTKEDIQNNKKKLNIVRPIVGSKPNLNINHKTKLRQLQQNTNFNLNKIQVSSKPKIIVKAQKSTLQSSFKSNPNFRFVSSDIEQVKAKKLLNQKKINISLNKKSIRLNNSSTFTSSKSSQVINNTKSSIQPKQYIKRSNINPIIRSKSPININKSTFKHKFNLPATNFNKNKSQASSKPKITLNKSKLMKENTVSFNIKKIKSITSSKPNQTSSIQKSTLQLKSNINMKNIKPVISSKPQTKSFINLNSDKLNSKLSQTQKKQIISKPMTNKIPVNKGNTSYSLLNSNKNANIKQSRSDGHIFQINSNLTEFIELDNMTLEIIQPKNYIQELFNLQSDNLFFNQLYKKDNQTKQQNFSLNESENNQTYLDRQSEFNQQNFELNQSNFVEIQLLDDNQQSFILLKPSQIQMYAKQKGFSFRLLEISIQFQAKVEDQNQIQIQRKIEDVKQMQNESLLINEKIQKNLFYLNNSVKQSQNNVFTTDLFNKHQTQRKINSTSQNNKTKIIHQAHQKYQRIPIKLQKTNKTPINILKHPSKVKPPIKSEKNIRIPNISTAKYNANQGIRVNKNFSGSSFVKVKSVQRPINTQPFISKHISSTKGGQKPIIQHPNMSKMAMNNNKIKLMNGINNKIISK